MKIYGDRTERNRWNTSMKIKDALAELDEKPLISIPTAGVLLGLSRSGAYEAAARGEIETLRIGRLKKVISAPLREQLKIRDKERKTPP
jgi:hypothetical protein